MSTATPTRPRSNGSRPTRFAFARKGTAEIELVLSIVVLITLLTLTVGAMRIALARLDTANTAQFEVQFDATSSEDPQLTGRGDLTPIDGIGASRPGLPQRTHVATPTAEVRVSAGNREQIETTVGGKAGLISPAWNFAAYPVGGSDRDVTGDWFGTYTEESHGQLVSPLRLAPAWQP